MAATEERKIEQLNVEEAIGWMKSNFTGVDKDAIESRMRKYQVDGADLLAMGKDKLERLVGELNVFKVDTFFNTIHAAQSGENDEVSLGSTKDLFDDLYAGAVLVHDRLRDLELRLARSKVEESEKDRVHARGQFSTLRAKFTLEMEDEEITRKMSPGDIRKNVRRVLRMCMNCLCSSASVTSGPRSSVIINCCGIRPNLSAISPDDFAQQMEYNFMFFDAPFQFNVVMLRIDTASTIPAGPLSPLNPMGLGIPQEIWKLIFSFCRPEVAYQLLLEGFDSSAELFIPSPLLPPLTDDFALNTELLEFVVGNMTWDAYLLYVKSCERQAEMDSEHAELGCWSTIICGRVRDDVCIELIMRSKSSDRFSDPMCDGVHGIVFEDVDIENDEVFVRFSLISQGRPRSRATIVELLDTLGCEYSVYSPFFAPIFASWFCVGLGDKLDLDDDRIIAPVSSTGKSIVETFDYRNLHPFPFILHARQHDVSESSIRRACAHFRR